FMIRQSGSGFITVPIMDGQPIGEEQYRRLNEQQIQDIEKRSARLQEKMIDFTNQIRDLEKEVKQTLEQLDHRVALTASGHHIEVLKEKDKPCDAVITYLVAIQTHMLNHIGGILLIEQEKNVNTLTEMFRRSSQVKHIPNIYYVN